MATAAPPLPPPPPGQDQQASGPATGTPSAPAQPSPAMQQGTQLILGVVNQLRSIAQAYPSAAPLIAQINDLMRQVSVQVMKSQSPGEPQAGPGA